MTSSAARINPPAPIAKGRLKMCSCEGRSLDSSLLGPRIRGGVGPLVRHLHDQRGVGPAETEAVVEHSLNLALLRFVRNEVDALCALARIVEVERWWNHLVAESEY